MAEETTHDRITRLEADQEHHAAELRGVKSTVIEHDRWIAQHTRIGDRMETHDDRLQKLEQFKAQVLVLAALGSLLGSFLSKLLIK